MLNRSELSGSPTDQLAVKDSNLVYRACTRQFAAALGMSSPEEIIGKSDFDILPPAIARQQLVKDSRAILSAEPDISTLSLIPGQQLIVVRTPILTDKHRVRGIDLRLLSDADDIASVVDYRCLVEEGLQGSLVIRDDEALYADQNAAAMLGFANSAELLANPLLKRLFPKEAWNRIKRNTQPQLNGSIVKLPLRFKVMALSANGEELLLLARAQEIRWEGQSAVLFSFVDVDMQSTNPTLLQKSEQRYKHYAKASADFFWELDEQLRFSFISDELGNTLGMSVDDLMGKTHEELLDDNDDRGDSDDWAPQLERLKSHQPFRDFEFSWSFDGAVRVIRYSGIPIYDSSHVFMGYRGTGRDVTAANRFAESVAYHANHDALTGLVNRRHFEILTDRALSQSKTDRLAHAMCFMDLDSFKIVNDTCGHLAGDELLRQLSAMFNKLVRKSDVLARLGGDEFGVLLYNCSVAEALKLANQIRSEVENFQFLWEGNRFQVGISVGLVIVDDRWNNLNALFSAADSACYLAKNEGRNRVVVYREGDGHASNRKVEIHWVDEINAAFDDDRIVIARQEIKALSSTADGSRLEIFIRLKTPGGEIINPKAFLPSAERYGLSSKLDTKVIELTLQWLKASPRLLHSIKSCSMNLASGSFANPEFADSLINTINNSGIPPSKLCFELTETATIANLSAASAFMQKISKLGCRFALDDFGSGLSSFAYLKQLPVDYLKIDGLLIKDIPTDPIDFTMAKAINEISQSLGLQTIAEFVETPEILEAVKEIGIDFAQGYEIGRPELIELKS